MMDLKFRKSVLAAQRMYRRVWLMVPVLLILLSGATFGQKAELVVQTGHAHSVEAAAFSKDGSLLATGDAQRGVKVWETASGRLLRSFDQNELHAEDDEFWPLKYVFAFSNDKRFLAVSYGQEDEFLIWRLSDGQMHSTIELDADGQGVRAARFIENDAKLVVMGANLEFPEKRSMSVYSVASGKLLQMSRVASKYVSLFETRERIIADVSEDLTQITMTPIFSRVPVFKHHGLEIEPIVTDGMTGYTNVNALISGDGKRVAINNADGHVRIYNIIPKKLVASLPVGASKIVSCDLDRRGTTLVCMFRDRSVRRWREAEGPNFSTLIEPTPSITDRSPETAESGETRNAEDPFIRLSPDERSFVMASAERSPLFVDINDPESSTGGETMSGPIDGFQVSGDRSTLMFGFRDNVTFWKLSGERRTLTAERLFGSEAAADPYNGRNIVLSPNAQFFTTRRSEDCQLWQLENAAVVREFKGLFDLAFSNDSRYLAGRSLKTQAERRAFLWDIAASREVWSKDLAGSNDAVFDGELKFGEDGRLFFGSVEIDLNDGSEKGRMPKQAPDIFMVGIYNYGGVSPKGTLRYIDGGMVCVSQFYNVRTKVQFVRPICSLAITDDEKHMIGQTDHGEIKVLDIDGKDILTLIPLGETDWVVAAPDGRFDTSMDLSSIQDLHWITSDDPLTPKPLEIFMRQYFEPGLLDRTLRCTREGTCSQEFKPLPSIGQVNRVQPVVGKPAASTRTEKVR